MAQMRAVSIARVSTPSQRDNTSPEGQTERNRAYAVANNITIIDEMVEVESGGLILARAYNPQSPVYQALRMVERGEIDCVIFDIPDRLGRGDVIPVFEFMFRQAGATVLYAQPADTETMQGFIAHSAQSLISGVERINIRRRLMEGRVNSVRRGRILGVGKPPYGYEFQREFDAVGNRTSTALVPVQNERETWLRAYHLFTIGGVSVNAIAKRFSDEGVPLPSPRHIKRKTAIWSASTLRAMMKNPVYGGRWYYGREESKTVDTNTGSKSRVQRIRRLEEIPFVAVEGFITWDEWLALQDELATRNHHFTRPTKNDYLLRGLLRCAKCGHTLIGHATTTARYYGCAGEWSGERKCPARHLNAQDAESQVWAQFTEWLLDDANIAEGMAIDDNVAVAAMQSALQALEKERVALAGEMKRIVRAYAKRLNGVTLAALEDEQRRIEQDAANIDAQIQRLRMDIHAAQQTARERERAGDLKEELSRRLRGSVYVPFSERSEWIRAMKLTGVWDAATDQLTITCMLGASILTSRRYATRASKKRKT